MARTYDAEFIDGFDKYGPISAAAVGLTIFTDYMQGEWTGIANDGIYSSGFFTISIVASLFGPGYALQTKSSNDVGAVQKSLPGNYARIIGGAAVKSDLLNSHGFTFTDGVNDQLSIILETNGTIGIRQGAYSATQTAASSQSLASNSTNYLEWDLVFHQSAGSYKVWLNGVLTSLNASSVKTAYGSTNNYCNTFRMMGVGSSGGNTFWTVDHLYLWMYLTSGSADTPALSNPIVETEFVIADSSIQFTPGAAILGTAFANGTTATNAPGANKLVLVKVTNVATGGTLQSVSTIPGATSGAANFKGVVYADNGSGTGPTGAPLSSGTQVTGATISVPLVLPLVTPQALTVNTIYWIGFITDTSVVLFEQDATSIAYISTNTYSGGAPTSPTMTSGQPTWSCWGNMTGMTSGWTEVQENPGQGDLDYTAANVVGKIDQYIFPTLTTIPQTIYTVAFKALVRRADAGARKISLVATSSGTQGSGNAPNQGVPMTYGYVSSYFDFDPHTPTVPWTFSGVNAATAGPMISS